MRRSGFIKQHHLHETEVFVDELHFFSTSEPSSSFGLRVEHMSRVKTPHTKTWALSGLTRAIIFTEHVVHNIYDAYIPHSAVTPYNFASSATTLLLMLPREFRHAKTSHL